MALRCPHGPFRGIVEEALRYNRLMMKLAPLLSAAFFLIAGSITVYLEPQGLSGTALICAGLITLGGWIAVESHRAIKEEKNDE